MKDRPPAASQGPVDPNLSILIPVYLPIGTGLEPNLKKLLKVVLSPGLLQGPLDQPHLCGGVLLDLTLLKPSPL